MTGSIEGIGVHPGRDQRLLESVATQLERTRTGCLLLDADLRVRWVSTEFAGILDAGDGTGIGYGEGVLDALASPPWRLRITERGFDPLIHQLVPHLVSLAEETGGRTATAMRQLAETLKVTPVRPPAVWSGRFEYADANLPPVELSYLAALLVRPGGGWFGAMIVLLPPLRARVLDMLARGDEAAFERMAQLTSPEHGPAAILFADLQGSTTLSRQLPSGDYFAFMSALLSAADAVVLRHEGIVGKNAGDGVTAFFRARDFDTPSATVSAALHAAAGITDCLDCLDTETARYLRAAGTQLQINIGLHFSPGLYLGRLVTGGRLEVTALGSEVNACARIQESARGGQILASRQFLDQLNAADAADVGVDRSRLHYGPLGQWPTATNKARRDTRDLQVTAIPVDQHRDRYGDSVSDDAKAGGRHCHHGKLE
ncbi:MAG: adenylate/guanylate cyclase domain-containing protein [Mycobacteriales bacterium]